MLMQEERELVVEYGKKMSADRLSTGTSGNISIYNAEKGLMAISPSGMDYFSTKFKRYEGITPAEYRRQQRGC